MLAIMALVVIVALSSILQSMRIGVSSSSAASLDEHILNAPLNEGIVQETIPLKTLPQKSEISAAGAAPYVFGPRRFNNVTNNLARGANLMTSISGCHISAWVYMVGGVKKHRDCDGWRSDSKVKINVRDGKASRLDKLQPYDTIYVHTKMLTDFIVNYLDQLKVPIVLLSGTYDNTRDNQLSHARVEYIYNHPMVAHWFCQNVYNSTGLDYLPPKLSPLALGIEPFDKNPKGPNPVVILRDVILRYARDGLPQKTIDVFEAYTSPFTNPNRQNVPRGQKMTLPAYLERLARSKFVLSPSGHKPDCFRHYEALALGAIPVTDLDAATYSHLALGPVVFGTRHWWNLTESKLLNRMQLTSMPRVNRNLIFEEFWMEEMERQVGRPLRWFDIRKGYQTTLEDMYMNYSEINTIIDSAWADYSVDCNVTLKRFVGERKAWKAKGWRMPYL